MPRLIDGDNTIEKLDCLFKETNVKCLDFMTIGYNHAVADSTAVVKGQPAIDAVEVLRCRDCIYSKEYEDNEIWCERLTGVFRVDHDGFCKWGYKNDET